MTEKFHKVLHDIKYLVNCHKKHLEDNKKDIEQIDKVLKKLGDDVLELEKNGEKFEEVDLSPLMPPKRKYKVGLKVNTIKKRNPFQINPERMDFIEKGAGFCRNFNPKKVYCSNCKYLFYRYCNAPQNLKLVDNWKESIAYNIKLPEELNIDNACSYYKRKWWKFWA